MRVDGFRAYLTEISRETAFNIHVNGLTSLCIAVLLRCAVNQYNVYVNPLGSPLDKKREELREAKIPIHPADWQCSSRSNRPSLKSPDPNPWPRKGISNGPSCLYSYFRQMYMPFGKVVTEML